MTGVQVDAGRGLVRVRAGVLCVDAVEAAAEHGLTVLHGSSPDVGVVGYSLGGGLGWYARSLGLQTRHITGATVVTSSGEIIRVDDERQPELMWGLRGGGGNFVAVAELEFQAHRFTSAYAGMLVWDSSRAEDVLRRWASWSVEAPDAVTTSLRLLRLPPLPEIPERFRGRELVVVDGAVLVDDSAAELIPGRAARAGSRDGHLRAGQHRPGRPAAHGHAGDAAADGIRRGSLRKRLSRPGHWYPAERSEGPSSDRLGLAFVALSPDWRSIWRGYEEILGLHARWHSSVVFVAQLAALCCLRCANRW